MIEITPLYGQIYLGKQGENLARMVCFDEIANWKKVFGEGRCELLHQRNGDPAPYPVVIEVQNDKICWKVTTPDTALAGEGKCELHYIVNDVVVKSKIWTTTVTEALGEGKMEAPEAQQAWVDQVLCAAEDVKNATANPPTIGENGNWYVWDDEAKEFVDSGIKAGEFNSTEHFEPVVIFDGIVSETTPESSWGTGGIVSQSNYTVINTLFDVLPNVEYKLVNFNGAISFYNTNALDYCIAINNLISGSYVTTEFVFTVPDGKYKMGLSMYQSQRLGDIKLYRLTPIEGETSQTVFTKDNFLIGKDNINPNDVKAFMPLYGKKIVNFGDSIFGMYAHPSDISTRLANLTGATVYNCGFSGCRMSAHSMEAYKPFSMFKIAAAVASGDFTEQETALNTHASTLGDSFAVNLNTLKNIDFNEVDIVTIAYGTNDFASKVLIDHASYPKNDAIFAGALRRTIETLLNAYPNLRIFLCTPIFRVWYNSSTGGVDKNSDEQAFTDSWGIGSQKLTDFVDKIKEVGLAYRIPVIDNYYELGISALNHKRYLVDRDGTHPTGEGLELISRHIASELF